MNLIKKDCKISKMSFSRLKRILKHKVLLQVQEIKSLKENK